MHVTRNLDQYLSISLIVAIRSLVDRAELDPSGIVPIVFCHENLRYMVGT